MLGVVGGTGLYEIEGLVVRDRRQVSTPFGEPSAPLTFAEFGGKPVVFLPRHGAGHGLLPSEINYRANIFALKQAGVTHLVSVSAVGSLREEIEPGDLALPSQYVDWTRGSRVSSFFGRGMVAHVSTAHPVSESLQQLVVDAAGSVPALGSRPLHRGKTYVCVEGPRLGTGAESHLFRSCGFDLVGMTNVPEVFLAREAQIAYATITVATDYDSWLDDPSQHVSVEKVISLFRSRVGLVKELLKTVIAEGKLPTECPSRKSLEFALLTPTEHLTDEHLALLSVLRA
jgi:5'-methylthioadenosine phosphorylase